ncbi:hypothetical protein COLO4_37831 [Corchorus olitorius]|uniref:Uncharacterized protein n=1 Tax=Corchorus olitorius TaxID=93759 RepID=A0A1R3FYZ9_9ROSI|nr:hypothetical protein COLO4_37831 [Corchorus olitorius]
MLANNSDKKSVINEESSSSFRTQSILLRKTMENVEMEFDIPADDIAWLKRSVVGRVNQNISMEAVKENVMALVLKAMGTVIKVANCSTSKENMEAAWVFVETYSLLNIPLTATGSWKGITFVIKISIDLSFSDDRSSSEIFIDGNNSDADDTSSSTENNREARLSEGFSKSFNDMSVELCADLVNREDQGLTLNECEIRCWKSSNLAMVAL